MLRFNLILGLLWLIAATFGCKQPASMESRDSSAPAAASTRAAAQPACNHPSGAVSWLPEVTFDVYGMAIGYMYRRTAAGDPLMDIRDYAALKIKGATACSVDWQRLKTILYCTDSTANWSLCRKWCDPMVRSC